MSYQSFMPDPSLWKLSEDFRKLCGDGEESKAVLRLVDGCFSVFCKAKTLIEFCALKSMKYPVDSHQSIDFQIAPQDTLTLFDNMITDAVTELNSAKTYARGIILVVEYPHEDNVGAHIEEGTKVAQLTEFNAASESFTSPLGDFYAKFSNPVTTDKTQITNKLTVTNPSSTFPIRVKALIIYTKTENGEGCGCEDC